MSTATVTGTDLRLRDSVVRELEWDPAVDASAIGAAAKEGVVTLTGFIDSYVGKLTAERVAKRVRGVRAVANDIVVRLVADRPDPDIARDVVQILKVSPTLTETVQASVHQGRVTLTGTVQWLFQKQQAEEVVRHVDGIHGVFNHITVAPKAAQRDVHRRIVRALHRDADLDAGHIDVAVDRDLVTLTGTVSSWLQREAAERAAGSAPGITRVENAIVVTPGEPVALEPEDEIC